MQSENEHETRVPVDSETVFGVPASEMPPVPTKAEKEKLDADMEAYDRLIADKQIPEVSQGSDIDVNC